LDDNRDVDGLEKARLAACLGEPYCYDLSVGGLAIPGGQESEALRLVHDTCRVMKRLVREAAKAGTPECTADATVCRRLRVEHAERLVVLPHFRETGLRQGQTTVLSDLWYRHIAEGYDPDTCSTRHLVQRFDHLVVGFAEIHDSIVRGDTPTDELIIKVPVGDE
jgi:hypothetical protein